MLKIGGVNHVGYVFLNIIGTGFFDEVMHDFFCLFIVAMRGEENAKSSAIDIMTISGESFLPEINRGIDVFALECRNVSVVFSFGFEYVELMLKIFASGLSNVFLALKLLILFQKDMIESRSLSSVLRDLA